jgi:tetratricopeptide (TPR) repeat protein
MSNSKFKEFARVEQLFDNGELDNAYQVLIESIPYSELNLQQKYHFHLIKGLILLFQSRTEELIILGKQTFNDGQLQNDNLQSLDGIFFILLGRVGSDFKVDEEVFAYFEQSNKLLEKLTAISEIDFILRDARLNLVKVMAYLIIGDLDLADKHITMLLRVEKDLKHTFERVWIYILLARRMLQGKVNYDHALEYAKKALSLAESIRFNHFWVAICHVGIGAVKYVIGEFEESLKHSLKSVIIYKKINNKSYLAMTLNNIGGLYAEIGDYGNALKYLEESLSLWKQGLPAIETVLDSIITAAVNKGDIVSARKYFRQIEELYDQQKTPIIELIYKYNKALLLKNSPRIRAIAKAEKLFKQVAKTNLMAFDIKIKALIHLCDLYLTEYRFNKDDTVLNDITLYISKLQAFAEESHSYLLFCETFILQAKVALFKFNVKTARRYLTNAQKIAESHGMKRLAIKISYEHDAILSQLKKWEELEKSGASLAKRMELARINEQMEYMVKKKPN